MNLKTNSTTTLSRVVVYILYITMDNELDDLDFSNYVTTATLTNYATTATLSNYSTTSHTHSIYSTTDHTHSQYMSTANFTYSTTDLTPKSSSLTTGKYYFKYD